MSNHCDCDCECGSDTVEKEDLISMFPKKKEALVKYIESLDLGSDVDKNRGFLIQTLHKAQEIFDYLPEVIQLFVAAKLGLHVSEVYGVISFYSYFTDKPVGEFKINVCTGTACFVKGAGKILSELERFIGIKDGETSEDMKYSLGGIRCVGACGLAPVVTINGKVYGKVKPKDMKKIIKDHIEKEGKQI